MIVNITEPGLVSDEASRAGVLSLSGEIDESQLITQLRLSNGDTLSLPTELLLQKVRGSQLTVRVPHETSQSPDEQVVPIVEERLNVAKRTVSTGVIQIIRRLEEYSETVETPLTSITFEISRQAVNRLVSERPAPREEGETTIYSVVEERVVLATELILKEEIRVTRRETVTNDRQVVTLYRDHVDVKRSSAKDAVSQQDLSSLEQKAAL